ncbi:MAG: ferritin-like domain-containing protein [Candidatus Bathyarchaeia archaeon]
MRDLKNLQLTANCSKVNFPEDPDDLKGMIRARIEAENCAIDVYNNLLKKLEGIKDPVTSHLIGHILSEEVEHKNAFENLL